MEIRKAAGYEYEKVRAFYHSLIDSMQDAEYKPMWEKDVYPSAEFLQESIQNGELYIGLVDDEIAAAMVLNNHCNEGYKQYDWQVEADDSEISVIHALGVHSKFGGRGFAKQMVLASFQIGRKKGQKVIRLDVLGGNLPAEKLYTGLGFKYMTTVNMFYEDTGWTDFQLYEYVL